MPAPPGACRRRARGFSQSGHPCSSAAVPGPKVTGSSSQAASSAARSAASASGSSSSAANAAASGLTAASAISARNTASYGDLRSQAFGQSRVEYAPAAPAVRGLRRAAALRDIRGTLAENPATRRRSMASPCFSYCVFRSIIAWPRSRLSPCTCSNRCSDNERVRSNSSDIALLQIVEIAAPSSSPIRCIELARMIAPATSRSRRDGRRGFRR